LSTEWFKNVIWLHQIYETFITVILPGYSALNISPLFKCCTTLPCKMSMSACECGYWNSQSSAAKVLDGIMSFGGLLFWNMWCVPVISYDAGLSDVFMELLQLLYSVCSSIKRHFAWSVFFVRRYSSASWVKKVGRPKSCNFPTEEIMGAQNFNVALKFHRNTVFSPNLTFLDESCPMQIIFRHSKI